VIITETIGDRIHTYSDTGMKIKQDQTGIIYDDAMDVPEKGYTYIETDEPIQTEDLTSQEILDILLDGESL
jgi:hypothetical protein